MDLKRIAISALAGVFAVGGIGSIVSLQQQPSSTRAVELPGDDPAIRREDDVGPNLEVVGDDDGVGDGDSNTGNGDATDGDDGTSGGANTGDGDATDGDDGTSGGANTGGASNTGGGSGD
jgi:hypothetical protein